MLAGNPTHDLRTLGLAQPTQLQSRDVIAAGERCFPLEPVRDDQQNARVANPHHRFLQQLPGGRVDPVGVFEKEQHRTLLCQCQQLRDQRLQKQLLGFLRGKAQLAVAALEGYRQQIREQRRVGDQVLSGAGQQRFELVEPHLVGVSGCKSGGMLQLPYRRVENTARVIGRALIANRREVVAGDVLGEALQQPRLADARLARNQHHLALAGLGETPAVGQQAQLVHAADEFRQRTGVCGFETGLRGSLRHDAPGPDRLAESLDRHRLAGIQLEGAADQPLGRRLDQYLPGLGCGLQPRREVRGVAERGVFLRGALPDDVADHDIARGDSDPGRERVRRGER